MDALLVSLRASTVQDVVKTVSERPRATLALAAASLALLYAAKTSWSHRRIRKMLATLPKPAGSLPVFGHALELVRSCPWLLFEKWAKSYDYKPYCIDFMMEVR